MLVARRWKLSNDERDRAAWLVRNQCGLENGARRAWSEVQPLLAHQLGPELVQLLAARSAVLGLPTDDVEFCRAQLARPREELDPPPWVTGDDLVRLGLRPGREFSQLLQSVRVAQLDGTVATPEAATELALRLAGRLDDPPAAT